MSAKTADLRMAQLCDIRSRYRRSVHLERDADDPTIMDGYVLTPLARKTLSRIVEGLTEKSRQRAWTLTGPYGSGKSSFEVFLFSLLTNRNERAHAQARYHLKAAEPGLFQALFSGRGALKIALLPVTLTGERTRLDDALIRALERAVLTFWSGPGARAEVVGKVQHAARNLQKGKRLAASEIVALIEETAEKVAGSANDGQGLMLVIDEMGKFLEHAAMAPAESDLYLLQLLAEASARSDSAPILLITTLHQSFDRYAARLGNLQRNEWSKIQGRFEDIAFQESSEQILQLLGEAISFKSQHTHVRAPFDEAADSAAKLFASQAGVREERLALLLKNAAPLHPSTALVLGPVFRSYAGQNERSLFAFLSSSEPFGFQSFLQTTPFSNTAALPVYRIPDLYDYLSANLGSALEVGANGRRWGSIADALSRLGEHNTEIDAAVLKTVGLLHAMGASSPVPASGEFIQFSLDGLRGASRRMIDESLKRLVEQSVLVYRKYKGAFQLWDGSDFDVEALLEAARGKVDASTDLASELGRLYPARPLIAKRHLFHTGTLRHFDVRYVNAKDVQAADALLPEAEAPDADGLLLYVIPSTSTEAGELRKHVVKPHFWLSAYGLHRRPLILAVPDDSAPMRDSLVELAAIEKVRQDTLGLHSDPVARRELAARSVEAQEHLQRQVDAMFGLARRDVPARCEFYFNQDGEGERRGVRLSSRALSALGSALFDRAFHKAPVIKNELINRGHLSSSAASARRLLLEAMLTTSSAEDFGFEGSPPEKAILRAVLQAHGLHRKVQGVWQVAAPPDMNIGLGPAWSCLESLLERHDGERIPVSRIFEELGRPPYGLKTGVMPLLLTAALINLDSEVAVYEETGFVPRLTPAVVERLVRAPEKFTVQRSRIDGARAQVFDRFADVFISGDGKGRNRLVRVVKQFTKLVSDLPAFSLNTKRLSPQAIAVRDALVKAKEPAHLLFQALPVACGLQPFDMATRDMDGQVDEYFRILRRSLGELDAAYEALLRDTTGLLSTALALPPSLDALRPRLGDRAKHVARMAIDPKLKSFLVRASDEHLDDKDWLLSLLTQVVGRPPTQWADPDLDAFQARLGLLAETFRTFEALAFSTAQHPDKFGSEALRLAMARAGGLEHSRVVRVEAAGSARVSNAEAAISAALATLGLDVEPELALAALARVAERLLQSGSLKIEAQRE